MLKLATTVLGAIVALVVLVAAAVSGVISAAVGRGDSATASQPSQAALSDIPGDYLALYRHAATTCPGLDWSILAAIGKIETNHGRSNLPGVHSGSNKAGAGGPMQFLQSTFDSVVERHHIPPGGSTPPSRYNPHDAIYAAAGYLCESGAHDGRDLDGAIYAYNRADSYVRKVLDQASTYRATHAAQHQARAWTSPVNGRCTSEFGPRGARFHSGQDIAAPVGTPIHAATSGRVIDAGPARGYGLWVRIRHPNGVITTYGHNHRNHVHPGERVRAGQIIAQVGNRGHSTGPHLHFEIETAGQKLDPVAVYQRQGTELCGNAP
ncbi:peptidoglycan DD-metalloendopeptidase family protein [Haloechinothrix aidingensis]|uniref:peptidoglycan DD-metalloendopeptidase family protein n=1 Tax=Haloechinothrix aidingensis TaxID=2752311 RepID=UPI001FEB2C70|nr:peptidoglycan DD-metalloendopeptidase family protein [Haloechinothrix aidingensis]